MRLFDPNHEPSKEFSEFWGKELKKPIQPSTDPRGEPFFITKEFEQELLAKGETWASDSPPAVQRHINRKNKEE